MGSPRYGDFMRKKESRISKYIRLLFMTWILVFAGFLSLFNITENVSAGRSTNVSGIISTNTTWTVANSPYIITGNVLVNPNINLTIHPGVNIKFDSKKYLRIDGTIYAVGTASQMIIFTSNQVSPKPGDWGGIRFEESSEKSLLKYCKIEYGGGKLVNSNYYGGGIYNKADDLKISYCFFENNTADSGGGIANSGILELDYCTFKNNLAKGGGGILNNKGMVTIYHCLISNNQCTNVGGGIGLDGGSAAILDSIIRDNVCNYLGGGIYSYDGPTFISNCKITNNTQTGTLSGDGGGGIANSYGGRLTIEFSLINNNSAAGKGGGIWTSGKLHVKTTTISNNSNYGIHGDSFEYTSIIYSSITNNTAGGIKGNPHKIEYSNLDNSNYNLYLLTSSDIDAPNNWWGETDTNLINQSIYDFNDDFELGKVNYLPILTSSINISNKSTRNQAPTARAGADQNVAIYQKVILNGSSSFDPDSNPLNFKWSFGDGTYPDSDHDGIPDYKEGVSSPSIVSHIYNKTGDYTVTLTVSDGLLWDIDTCIIHVGRLPIANAGPDQSVKINQTVNFDGSNSYDPDGDTLTYNWSFGDGTSTGWQSTSKASHKYTKPGNYTVTLTISDGKLTGIDTCIVTVKEDTSTPMDTDGDGLSDAQEITYHTDLEDADSDDDGVLDGAEINWNADTDNSGTINALDHDSDNDGIFDGTEMGITKNDLQPNTDLNKNHFFEDADPTTNTSMVHWDTDGDHLGDGEEDKNKNGRLDKELNETDPLFADRDNDGIEDKADDDIDGDGMTNEFEWLFELDAYDPLDAYEDLDGDGYTNYEEYLGDDNKPGNKDWTDPKDPNHYPKVDPYVDTDGDNVPDIKDPNPNQNIDSDGDGLSDDYEDFYDGDATTSNPWPVGGDLDKYNQDTDGDGYTDGDDAFPLDPTKWVQTDTDGDGLPDSWEIIYFGDLSNESQEDPDGDSLTNIEEYRHGTNPMHKDTDGDGQLDGWEVKFGYDPLDPASVPGADVGYKDTDGDGIPDAWEIKYGLNISDASDAALDYDSDSLTNLEEYRKGTDPTLADTDNDGYSDKIDYYPTDPRYHQKIEDKKSEPSISSFTIIIIVMVIVLILILVLGSHVLKKRSRHVQRPFDDDRTIRKVRNEIIHGKQTKDLTLSDAELQSMLERDYRAGELSEGTLNYILDKNLINKPKR